MQALFSYLVEETLAGRGGKITEFAIAMDVFGRSSDFDPRQASIVRVQMGKVRSALDWYFRGPGAGDPLLLTIPSRSYVPGWSRRPALESRRRAVVWSALALVALLAAVAVLYEWRTRSTKAAEVESLYRNGFSARTPEAQLTYYEQALALAPDHVASLSALAQLQVELGFNGTRPLRAAIESGRNLAQRALRLDPASSDAHLAMGMILFGYDWNWPAAEREFRQAIRFSPVSDKARRTYATLLAHLGRVEEAVEQLRAAIRHDALSDLNRNQMGMTLFYQHRPLEALPYIEETLRLDPQSPIGHYWLGRIQLSQGRVTEAIASLETMARLTRSPYPSAGALGQAYVAAGRRDDARALLALLQREVRPELGAYKIAQVYTALGDQDEAMDWLEMAFHEKAFSITALKVDPSWDLLRRNARFQLLLKQLNL